MSAAKRLGREGRGVGQAAGERDDLGALGDRHQVAHRRGLHDPRARGEQPGVALEVARRADAARGGHGATVRRRRPGPWRRSSIVMRSGHAYRDHEARSSTSSRHRPRRRRRHPAVPARRCWPARSPAPTSASTSTAPTSRSSRRPAFLLRRGARRGRRCWLSARGCETPAGVARACGGIAHRPRRAAVRRRARRPLRRLVAGPDRRRRCAPRSRGAAVARPARRARARGSTRGAPRRCPSTPRAPRSSLAGAGDPRPAASRCSALGFLVWLLVGGRRRAGEKYAGLRILR